jgi:TolB-like protein
MSFITELKRRNVFRVAALYAVGSWLLLQVGDILFGLMGLPDWALRIVLGILLLGFPVALVLAWVYELTPDGIRREREVASYESIVNDTGHKLNVVVIAAVVLALLVFGFDRMLQDPAADVQTEPGSKEVSAELSARSKPAESPSSATIAVLPFADMSPEGDQAYFSDGIAEEILNVLVKVDGLAVASRTSSFQFRNREGIGIPTIADELNVRLVLEGSVRTAGETIRVTAQLIDAQADQHLWSETFDRTLTTENLFAIQDEIATAIVSSIRGDLGIEVGETQAAPMPTANVDAYTMFLKGRSIYRSRVALDEAEQALAQAFELDPTFAEARAMQAAIYTIAPEFGYALASSSTQSREFARELAAEALMLDPDNALAFGVIGLSRQSDLGQGIGDWNYGQVMQEFNRALDIEPDNLSVLNWRGLSYLTMGYFEESQSDFVRCTDIEPTYAPCRTNLALSLIGLQRREEANQEMLDAARKGALGPDVATLITLADLERREAFYYVAASLRVLRGWYANEELYDALLNPQGDHTALRQRLARFLHENGLESSTATELLIALGDFEHDSLGFAFWLRPYTQYRQSDGFKHRIDRQGISDYWREAGFPDMCQPLGEDDFECR